MVYSDMSNRNLMKIVAEHNLTVKIYKKTKNNEQINVL